MIKYSDECPEYLYNRCKEVFNIDWDTGLILTFGDTIYCKYELSEELKVHEETHVEQQAELGRDLWWDLYLTNKEFRLAQEVEAYKNQVAYGKEHYNHKANRQRKKHILDCMVNMYGNMCTKEQAEQLIYG